MINKLKISLLSIIFLVNIDLFSQVNVDAQGNRYKSGVSNILNAANPEDIGIRNAAQVQEDKDDPLVYGYVDDKDVLWSTTVWEIIDLDQRVNYPLLYPVTFDVVADNRRPMLWWLRQEIEKGNLDVYDRGGFHGEFIRKEEKIDDIFKIQKPTERGRNRIDDASQELKNLITVQVDSLNFNPYENPNLLSDEQKSIVNDTTFQKIFPFKIQDFEFRTNSTLTSDLFTYEMFKGFTNDDPNVQGGAPVRIMQPDGYADPLSLDEITEYTGICAQIIQDYFFVEGVDFYYLPLEYYSLKQWLIKGIWYFDKKYSELIYRPIGIAPVTTPIDPDDNSDDFGSSNDIICADNYEAPPVDGPDSDNDGLSDLDEDSYGTDPLVADTDGDGFNDGDEINKWFTEPTDVAIKPTPEEILAFDSCSEREEEEVVVKKSNLSPLFWIYYPHARDILKLGRAYNERNTSKSITFDDIINSRRFSSVIYKEENVYENREVKDYIKNNSFMRLLESERIKEKIRNFEHDMWSW